MVGYISCDQDYKFGLNGILEDYEVKGNGNSLDFGARNNNSRIARWMSVDLVLNKYPFINPYHFEHNNFIKFIDIWNGFSSNITFFSEF